jgi:hypothetical protein
MSDVDRTLIAAGFSWRGGQLQPGNGSDPLVRLAPVRDRYQVTISVPGTGNAVVFDVPKTALRVKREGPKP